MLLIVLIRLCVSINFLFHLILVFLLFLPLYKRQVNFCVNPRKGGGA